MAKIELPELHSGQLEIAQNLKRFNVIDCGRRFGKDVLLEDITVRYALRGKYVGIIAPTFKMSNQNMISLLTILKPLLAKKSGSDNQILLKTGGVIDFWSLENFESIRGRKYHASIVNEAAVFRHLEKAWTETIRPTLTDYLGAGFFFSTPRGKNYFKTLYDKSLTFANWASFHKTSYDNPKLHVSEIDEAKLDLPELVFRQEYMAEFVDGAGTLLSSAFIQYYEEEPKDIEIVMGVDLAISEKSSADYTAIVVMARNKASGRIYIVDCLRERLSFNEILKYIELIANKYNPKVIGVEQVAFQAAVVQELIRTTTLNIKGIRPDKDKVTRFQPLLARFEQGLVEINKEIRILKDYENELLSFPLSTHDDMVDATSLAYSLLNKPVPSFQF